jgi:hypothetical protein
VVQAVEELLQDGYLAGGDTGPQPLVKRDGGGTQPVEHRITRLGEFHDVDATVIQMASASEQPGRLHGVEVVGQRRTLDPNCR